MYASGAGYLVADTAQCLPGWNCVIYLHFPSVERCDEGAVLLQELQLQLPVHGVASGTATCAIQDWSVFYQDDGRRPVCPCCGIVGAVHSTRFPHLVVIAAAHGDAACMMERFLPIIEAPMSDAAENKSRNVYWDVVVVRDCDRSLSGYDAWIIYKWLKGVQVKAPLSDTKSPELATAPQLLRYYDDQYAVEDAHNPYAMPEGVPIVGGSFAIAWTRCIPSRLRTAFSLYFDRIVKDGPAYCCDQRLLETIFWEGAFRDNPQHVTTIRIRFTGTSIRIKGDLGSADDPVEVEMDESDDGSVTAGRKRPRGQVRSPSGGLKCFAEESHLLLSDEEAIQSHGGPSPSLFAADAIQRPIVIAKAGLAYTRKLRRLCLDAEARIDDTYGKRRKLCKLVAECLKCSSKTIPFVTTESGIFRPPTVCSHCIAKSDMTTHNTKSAWSAASTITTRSRAAQQDNHDAKVAPITRQRGRGSMADEAQRGVGVGLYHVVTDGYVRQP